MPKISNLPEGKEFEEFISAIFQCCGFYVERNVIEREEKEEILELDLVATGIDEEKSRSLIIEVKSGGWGFRDIFKIKGMIDYLGYLSGLLITIRPKERLQFYNDKATEIGIILIQIEDVSTAPQIIKKAIQCDVFLEEDFPIWRYSHWVERNLLRDLKYNKKKHYPDRISLQKLDEYYFLLNSGIFFTESIVQRVHKLYKAFENYPHISAKCGNEILGNSFDDEIDKLPSDIYNSTYYTCLYNIIQISTFIEHKARLALLKSAVDYLLTRRKKEEREKRGFGKDFEKQLQEELPDTFIEGMETLETHKYFYRYPIFWQWFMWIFGGFILMDYEEKEYETLSKKTGIPKEEISNALESYQILFPQKEDGWFMNLSPNSNINVMKMFPVPFMGIGANYRLLLYTETMNFDDLNVSGSYTLKDLKKWNSLTSQVLGT